MALILSGLEVWFPVGSLILKCVTSCVCCSSTFLWVWGTAALWRCTQHLPWPGWRLPWRARSGQMPEDVQTLSAAINTKCFKPNDTVPVQLKKYLQRAAAHLNSCTQKMPYITQCLSLESRWYYLWQQLCLLCVCRWVTSSSACTALSLLFALVKWCTWSIYQTTKLGSARLQGLQAASNKICLSKNP